MDNDGTNNYRAFIDEAFGTNFEYYVEPPDASCPMPNGVISKWPIVDSGYWNDPEVFNRDYAWATISVPGANPLHVVSVHLKAGNSGSDVATRELQAQALTNLIAQNFSSTNFLSESRSRPTRRSRVRVRRRY